MAETRESVILDVKLDAGKVSQQLDEVVRQIANAKNEQKLLNEQLKNGDISLAEYTKSSIAVKDELANLNKEAKNLTATQKLLTADTDTYSSSLRGEQQRLADMQKAYDQLDAEQRNSKGGQQFLQALQAQDAAVKELEKSTGRVQRNVGNYPKVVTSIIPGFDKLNGSIAKMSELSSATPAAFGSMAQGIGQATKASLKFITTPIGAIIAAIVGAIALLKAGWDKLTEAIGKNDDAGTNIARLYSVTVQPVVDMVTKAFAKLAEWIGNVAGALADFLGGSADAATGAHELVVATDNLQEAERQYVVNSAKNNAKIAQLRNDAVDKEKYTAAERKKFLEEAIRLETENLEMEKKNKAEKLRILEETAKRERDTSDATKDKIAQARADLSRAEETYYTGTRKMRSQIVAFDKEEADAKKAAADAAKKAAEEKAKAEEELTRKQAEEIAKREELERRQAETLNKIRQQQEDLAVAMIGDAGVRAVEQRRLQGEREIEQLKQQLATDETLTTESRERLNVLILAKENQLQKDLENIAKEYAERDTLERQTKELQTAQKINELKKQVAKEGSAELLALQLEALDLQKQEELAKYAEGSEERLLIDQQYEQAKADLEQQYRDAKAQADMAVAEQALQQVTALNSAIADIQNAELQNYKNEQEEKKKALKKQLDAGRISQEQYNAQVQELDEETHNKEVELQRQQAKREKALGIFNATLSTFQAVIGFLAKPGGIPGIALSALAAITGAAQIAAIAAQPLPQFSIGTAQVGGGRYSDGDTQLVRLAPQEMVLNPRQITNVANGLFDYANNPRQLGGVDYELLGVTMANAVAEQPAPVMVYSEYNDFKSRKATYDELVKI